MKWLISLLIGAVLLTGLFLLSQDPLDALRMDLIVEQRPPIVLGVIPYLSPDDLRHEMNPILNYLAAKLNRPFRLNVAATYEDLARMLEMKIVHVAWFSHTSFQQLRGGHPWEVLVRPVQRGRASYFGRIITRKDSPIKTLEDLNGKTFAFVDRHSGSGFYFPNLMFKERGIDPLTFFGKVVFTHSHDASIDGVLNGIYDAAAVFAVNVNPRYQEKIPRLAFLAAVGPIPTDPMVVSNDLPEPVRRQIRDAMLTMHEDPLGREGIKELNILRGTDRFITEEEVQSRLLTEGVEEPPANRAAETGQPIPLTASAPLASPPTEASAPTPAPASTATTGTPPPPGGNQGTATP